MKNNDSFKEFMENFKLLAVKNHKIIINTLSNIFTMRLIGNKTHGDLAEIALSEFVNQFMYNYSCEHVGKDLFRAKEHEEDILVTHELSKCRIPISLKAYGDGPLQLSTDKQGDLYPLLKEHCPNNVQTDPAEISKLLKSEPFLNLLRLNILPLLYREKKMQCNIVHFDLKKVFRETRKIIFLDKNQTFDKKNGIIEKGRRTHSIFLFIDSKNNYLCEVRYGGKTANALQRGFWTHTQHAADYFDSLTNGWIDYSHNLVLVRLFSLALNSTISAHEESCKILQQGIDDLKAMK